MKGRLLNKGVSCSFIRTAHETRTNIIVNDLSSHTQTVFSAQGTEISPHELTQLVRQVENIQSPDFVIISGSLPRGIHPEIYRKIIELTKSNGVKVVLDTDGDGLRVGLRAIPNVIKPNIHELSRLVGRELTTTNNIIEAARHIHNQGVDIVLVSMGAKGILLIGEKEEYLAAAPVVKVKNTIGAGDSAVAGFVYGLVNGVPLKEALTYAVAAGTATTLRVGTALCQKDDFLKLVPEIQLQSIEPN